jgi:hypothetical protein
MGLICFSPTTGADSLRVNRHRLEHFCCNLVVLLLLASSLWAVDDDCRPVTAELGPHVTEYLAQRIVSMSGGIPTILSSSKVPGTCYEKLVIHVSGTVESDDAVSVPGPAVSYLHAV